MASKSQATESRRANKAKPNRDNLKTAQKRFRRNLEVLKNLEKEIEAAKS